jgi:hypothetical protein
MGNQYDEAVRLQSLVKASRLCCRGVGHKESAQSWKIEPTAKCEALQDLILSGKMQPGHGRPFKIYEPKERDILPPLFRDRVWQRSMCMNGIYDDMTRSLIYDNGACQVGKGTEQTVMRMVCLLERYYRGNGNNKGFVRHLDVRGYFPNTPHAKTIEIINRYVSEQEFIPHLEAIIHSFKDKRPAEVIQKDRFGERGTGLGSPISQLVQLAILSDIDHKICRMDGVQGYIRYMDDMAILTQTKEVGDLAAKYVADKLADIGLGLSDKGGNNRMEKGFWFLKKKFILTETGKVLVLPKKEKFSKERRVLRALKNKLDAGQITMLDVENHYESWISGLMILDAGRMIREMDRYYTKLFQKKPNYKCKKKSRRYRAMTVKHKKEKELIRDLQVKNAQLKADLMQAQAKMDYISMMTDVELVPEDGEVDQYE